MECLLLLYFFFLGGGGGGGSGKVPYVLNPQVVFVFSGFPYEKFATAKIIHTATSYGLFI